MKAINASVVRGLTHGTICICADNSGAKEVKIITVYRFKGRRRTNPKGGIADMVNVVVKKGKPEIRKKVSCGAYRNYSKETLMGKTVVCVVNFAPKKMGPEISEVLILGIANEKGETIYLTPESDVPLGGTVF